MAGPALTLLSEMRKSRVDLERAVFTKGWRARQLCQLGRAKGLPALQPPPQKPWPLLDNSSSHERRPGATKPR